MISLGRESICAAGKMNREKAIPLYYQIETFLRRQILSGELSSGSPLPNEENLGQRFNVSRITVRRASPDQGRP